MARGCEGTRLCAQGCLLKEAMDAPDATDGVIVRTGTAPFFKPVLIGRNFWLLLPQPKQDYARQVIR